MSTLGEQATGVLQAPYIMGTFEKRLEDFDTFIKDITYHDWEATAEERRKWIGESLRYDQFCERIRSLFDSEIRSQDLKNLYRKISTNPDALVDWGELFGLIQSGADDEELSVGEEVSVFTVAKRYRVGEAAGDRRRRDTCQCIRYVPAIDAYISASQKGGLAVWNNKLRLQTCVDINESSWTTGCDYLPTLRKIVCCTERSLVLWDHRSKGKAQGLFSVKPIEHPPQCVTYVPYLTGIHEDMLLYGDDQGYVNAVTITTKDLTKKTAKETEKRPPQSHSIEPDKLARPIIRRKLHSDWVIKITYFPELRCFASCSASSNKSFILEEVEKLFEQNSEIRGMSIPKGVNAFDYCARANIIATGGVDKIIRVWHPHIFSRPTGKLLGHLFTIVSVCCNERDQHIISLSTARVIRVWDIHTLTSLQIFTDNDERPGEKRIYDMIFDNKYEKLLTGSSVIDCWPLTRSVQDTMQVPHTHDRPINQIVYNKELKQLVSVCCQSILKVWEGDSGKLVYQLADPHGATVEVTSVTVSPSGYRLVTGATDGSVKVWDFGSGQELKSRRGFTTDDDLSITGLTYVTRGTERLIVATGWNNCIKVFLDNNEGLDLALLYQFNDALPLPVIPRGPSGGLSRSTSRVSRGSPSAKADRLNKNIPLPDIGAYFVRTPSKLHDTTERVLSTHEVTCVDVLGSSLVITGCSNGDIISWDVPTGNVSQLMKLPAAPDSGKARSKRMVDHRVNMIRVLRHRVKTIHPHLRLNSEPSKEEHGTPVYSAPSSKQVLQSPTRPVHVIEDDNVSPEENAITTQDDMILEKLTQNGHETLPCQTTTQEFDPSIVTVHQDGFIRFWSLEGEVVREMSRPINAPVTAICHDEDCNVIVTADNRGYLTAWDVGRFLEDPMSEEPELIKELITWRGHLSRVVSLEYCDVANVVWSGALDGSVRLWWGLSGKFLGFFGQHKELTFPTSEKAAALLSLPYDITENPVIPVKNQSAHQNIRVCKFDYPLIFDKARWEPFKRSAYFRRPILKTTNPENKKFFGALIKPRAYNHHLESSITAEMTQGAVFRALPVYRVLTPEKVSTPSVAYATTAADQEFMKANALLLASSLPAARLPQWSRQHHLPGHHKHRKHYAFSSTRNRKMSRFDHSDSTGSTLTKVSVHKISMVGSSTGSLNQSGSASTSPPRR